MRKEEDNDTKARRIACGCCDGMAEMMRCRFTSVGDYSMCSVWMKENWEGLCGQRAGKAAKEEDQGSSG